ncbi:MAG TPA: hypothetical protein VJS15_00605 [Allosphingosinicella sp.]|nr:hypothetical protein [Allosphingosinicella sp.]
MPTLDIPLPSALTEALAAPKCLDLSLPKPNLPTLTLPSGGKIQAICDITKGIPSDCSMNVNLMLQIAPIMASMECLLKVLKFIAKLVEVFKKLSSGDPFAIPGGLLEIVDAGEDLIPCFGMPLGITIPPFIKDLLLLIIKMLKCIVQALKSVVELLDGLELEIASAAQNGNDALAAQLECAKENGMLAAQGAMMAIDPIATVLEIAGAFFALMPGAPTIQLPSLAAVEDLDAMKTAIGTLEDVILVLEGIVEALPG